MPMTTRCWLSARTARDARSARHRKAAWRNSFWSKSRQRDVAVATSVSERKSCASTRSPDWVKTFSRSFSESPRRTGAMRYIKGVDREQMQLLPPTVEEYVEGNGAVRAIDLFVAGLDLVELGMGTGPATTGRPPYDPADLLKLYVYGYLHR